MFVRLESLDPPSSSLPALLSSLLPSPLPSLTSNLGLPAWRAYFARLLFRTDHPLSPSPPPVPVLRSLPPPPSSPAARPDRRSSSSLRSLSAHRLLLGFASLARLARSSPSCTRLMPPAPSPSRLHFPSPDRVCRPASGRRAHLTGLSRSLHTQSHSRQSALSAESSCNKRKKRCQQET